MTSDEFLKIMVEKTWRSNGRNTLQVPEYNNYADDDWRRELVMSKHPYYSPPGVQVKIHAQEVTRNRYSIPRSNGELVHVPATVLKTFRMEVTGDHFDGKDHLNAARFLVLGDHAISSPMAIDGSSSLAVIVRLLSVEGRWVMVNEILWSVQHENDQVDSARFHDIQKWYCCEYP